MENIAQSVFTFFVFCILGWIQESTIESLYHRRLINRGFMHGPYIPIYGLGGTMMLLICMPFEGNPFFVFMVGCLSCTALEYIVGALLEKIFNRQFWDYSMLKITYKNRISLVSSLFWGVLSLFMIYILADIMTWFCGLFDPNFLVIFNMIMMTVMAVDAVITVDQHLNLRRRLAKLSNEQRMLAVRKLMLHVGTPVDRSREWLLLRISRAKMNLGIANRYDLEKCRNEEEND